MIHYRALSHFLPTDYRSEKLSELCNILASGLEAAGPMVVANLETLSGIGRVAPEIIAQHIEHIVDYVLKVCS